VTATFDVTGVPRPEGPAPLAGTNGVPPAPAAAEDLSATSILQRIRLHHPSRLENRTLPRYQVLGELAHGAMAVVQEVFDEDLQRRLAMKVLQLPHDLLGPGLPQGDRKMVSRFLHEAQVISQLEHPGIVPIYDVGIDEKGRLYYTMPLIRGHDLRTIFDLVRAGDPDWSTTRALGVMLRVCEAMAFAHDRGVVHRDLKPANVMVGRFGEVYVLDWGLSCAVRSEESPLAIERCDDESTSVILARTAKDLLGPCDHADSTCQGDIVGSPPYMAPEQARGLHEIVGPRSDVYAVGAMLYHLLTGCMPYAHEGLSISPQAVLARSYKEAPRPIEKLAPDVSAELAAICHKAMSRDPRGRYADMQTLGRDLQAYLEHRVVRAYRTGALVELNKWCLRNKTIAITGTVALALLVGILAMALSAHRGDLSALVSGSGGEMIPAGTSSPGSLHWAPGPDRIGWAETGRELWGFADGAEPDTLEGLLDVVPEPDRSALREALSASLRSGSAFVVSHGVQLPDGSARSLETHGAPVLDEEGDSTFVLVVSVPRD
jgi:serine/threonine protein kinase